jgi:hypothetical protein
MQVAEGKSLARSHCRHRLQGLNWLNWLNWLDRPDRLDQLIRPALSSSKPRWRELTSWDCAHVFLPLDAHVLTAESKEEKLEL